MLRVEAKGLQAQLDQLTDLEREQLPFAAALALTRTAEVVQQALVAEMRAVFDRPTPYTLNSLRLFPATKEKLVARVWMKNEADKAAPATKWLTPQVYGGSRNNKRTEVMLRARGMMPEGKYVVPGAGAKLDQYGNISRGQLIKALSGVRAFSTAGYSANASNSRRSQGKGNTKRYFVMFEGAKREPIALAERTGRGRDGLKIILAFVSKPTYRKAFDFFGIAERVVDAELPSQFRSALAIAMRTRRRR